MTIEEHTPAHNGSEKPQEPLKLFDFSDYNFNKIPVNVGGTFYGMRGKHRIIMISKVTDGGLESSVGDGYLVAYIPLKGDLVRLGLFWSKGVAMEVAQRLTTHLPDSVIQEYP